MTAKVQDFVDQVDDLKKDIQSFFLSPQRWRSTKGARPLKWEKLKFSEVNKAKVPTKKGIYAFIVQHDSDYFPPHGFIMYIGITGHIAKNRTLNKRYKDYLREKKRNKRPRVFYMLNKWEDDLYFYYVPFNKSNRINLSKLEIDLNSSLIPPKGVKDFTAEIKAIRDAMQ